MRQGLIVAVAGALSACATSQGTFQRVDSSQPARPADCEVEIFRSSPPARPFQVVSRVNVHLEKTFFIGSDFDDALKELKRQACLSGADAIVNLQELSSWHLETRSYNVSGTGVRYLSH